MKNTASTSHTITHYALRFTFQLAFLLLFFALSLAQLTTTSPTFDEGFTLFRGYAAWRTGYLAPIGHPPLAHWLTGLGVSLEPNLPDPRSLDGWSGDHYDDSSRDLLWQRGLNAERIVFLGRIPILFLGLLLGAVTAHWAKDLFGWRSGLVALFLHALSPNLLAHSAVATTDLPVAAFYVFTLYAWYRFTKKPGLASAALTGLMLGCALASKFSALLLLPTLVILSLVHIYRGYPPLLRNPQGQPAEALRSTDYVSRITFLSAFILLFSLLTLWATYGFAFNPYPLAQYIRELSSLQSLASEGHTAYLFGLFSTKGWWYYHPVVFLVKTPIPLLLLIIYGLWNIVASARQSLFPHLPSQPEASVRPNNPLWENAKLRITNYGLLLSIFIYLAAATLSSLNVGYRYLLPALPILHIFAASCAQSVTRRGDTRYAICNTYYVIRITYYVSRLTPHASRITFYALLAWQFISTFSITPHFLAYFNEFVGPGNGYRILADSNLDWGQDLPALARYLDGRSVYLSYFGQADPAYYGIRSEPLPAWPPSRAAHFAPADPAPGLYAISASNLVGVQLSDPNTFAYFRDHQPLTTINYSIFIYEAPQRESITAFAQCGPPILNKLAVANLLDNRELRSLTFDCQNSLLIPARPGLLLYPEGHNPILDLGPSIFNWQRSDGTTYYRLYRTDFPSVPSDPLSPSFPLFPSKYLSLLDYTLTPQSLTLYWRVEELVPPPVSIFVHFNWPDGALADAYDALGVPAEYWQKGDVIIQRHTISPDLPPGEYPIVVGLYSLADGTRYSAINLITYKKQ